MLTTELAREDVLWASWARVAAGTSVPGVDGVTPASFGRELPGLLDELRDDLLGGRYQASPLRSLTINKNGRRRRLGLPTVRDRIVQRALLRVEDRALGGADAESSFAYRRGRSWVDALQRAAEYRDRGLRVVARADVREFFDSVDHGRLSHMLARQFPAEAVDLLMGWAAAPVLAGNVLRQRTVGLPQGAPVSPALANLYLRPFDAAVHGHPGQLIRYADDIAVFCRDETEAFVAQAHISTALASIGLSINSNKTYVSSFDRGFAMLGWVFFKQNGWAEEERSGWRHPLAVARDHPSQSGVFW